MFFFESQLEIFNSSALSVKVGDLMLEDLLPAIDSEFMEKAGSVPFLVEGAKRLFSEGATPLRPSVHHAHELTYVRRGKVKFFVKGRTYSMEEGHAIMIKQHQDHSYLIEEGPCEMIAIYFGFSKPGPAIPETFAQTARTMGRSGDPATNKKRKPVISNVSIEEFFSFTGSNPDEKITETQEPAFLIDGSYRKDVENLVERILDENKEGEFASELMSRLLAIELVIVVSRALRSAWEKSLRIRSGKAKELVEIAIEYINNNFDRDLSVADVANYVFLSQGYFARAFRDEVGMSPMSYMMKVRVDKSCELLAIDDLKVSSVASRVGFSSPQRFNSAFRKLMNMSPMEYRRKLQEQRNE